MAYTIRKLTDPTHEQIEELRAVFDVAFSSERGFECVVGPDDFVKLLSVLNRSQIVAGTLGGEIYIAEDANGKVIGGIIWYGPGREQYDSDDQRKEALFPLMESLSAEVKAWFAGTTPKMEEFKKRAFGELAKTEWYLQRVGVHPDWQGKGIGTALIEYGEQKKDGHAIVLQAVEPVNVGYYEHLGFKNKGHIDVEGLYGNFTVTGLVWQP